MVHIPFMKIDGEVPEEAKRAACFSLNYKRMTRCPKKFSRRLYRRKDFVSLILYQQIYVWWCYN